MAQRELLFEPVVVDVDALRERASSEETVKLRPYQAAAVTYAIEQFMLGTGSVLVVLPTGTGKSVVFSEVMKRWSKADNGKVLLLAHRRELLTQAIGHSARAGMSGELEMAANVASRSAGVVCASVQTLISKRRCGPCRGTGKGADGDCSYCGGRGRFCRYETFNPEEFSLIVTDEAHHAVASTYRTVYQWFCQNPRVKHLGVTATPTREDELGLGSIYDVAWDDLPLSAAIDEGWLVPVRQMFVRCSSLKFSKTIEKTRAGDYKEDELQKAFMGETSEEQQQLLHEVAYPLACEAEGGKTFVLFASGVEHARKLAESLASYPHLAGKVELLLGDTPETQRDEIMQRLRSGASVGLVNCGVCTEGFDLPHIEIVAIARPTKSRALYLQMIGRGTRPLPKTVDGHETSDSRKASIAQSRKPYCLVMDYVGANGALKQQTVGSVLSGLPVDDVDLLEAMNKAMRSQAAEDMQRLIEESREERMRRLEEAAERMRLAKQRHSTSDRIHGTGIYATEGEYTTDQVPLFDGRSFNAFRDYIPEPDGATQKQVNFLVKVLGVDPEVATRYTKRQAAVVIEKLQAKRQDKAPMRGLYRNRFPGRCALTGVRVQKGAGWARKNQYGKWETLSDAAARQLADGVSADAGYEDAPF